MKKRGANLVFIGTVFLMLTVGFVYANASQVGVTYTDVFQAVSAAPAFQFLSGPPPSAVFTNLTEQDVIGLKLTFTSAVPLISGYGVGADTTLASNDNLVVQFSGAIGPYGGIYAQWENEDARVLVAQWLTSDGGGIPIDLHQPIARMYGSAEYQFAENAYGITLDAEIKLNGSLSAMFDGMDIVRYRWEWDDGTVQEGVTAERTIRIDFPLSGSPFGTILSPGPTVTLTVWGPNGASASVTKQIEFRAPPVAL